MLNFRIGVKLLGRGLWVAAMLLGSILYAEIQSDVAFGSHFTIGKADAGLDQFDTKPLVYLGGGSLGDTFRRIKVLTQDYPVDEIECRLGVKIPSGTYRLYWCPKRGDEKQLLTESFYVMDPVLAATTPEWGRPGDKITLTGKYFGVNRPKVRLEYFDAARHRLVLLKCPVEPAGNFMNPDTGDSTLTFTIPRKTPDVVPVIVLRSPSGTGKIVFCSFPFNRQRNLTIPMRDAVELKGDLFSPVAEGPFPTLIFRTPYSKDEGDPYNERTFRSAVQRGYAVLVQDVRGRYASAGDYTPYLNEGEDGYDTIEWAAAQPWSTGDVGTFGLSYPGAVQWLAAIEDPPHLKAAVPAMCFSTLNQCLYFGGIFEIYWTSWCYNSMTPDIRVRGSIPGPQTILDAYREFDKLGGDNGFNSWLPTSALPYLKDTCQFYYDWITTPPYSDDYAYGEIRDNYANVHAAVLNLSGWYDEAYGSEGATTNFLGLLDARAMDVDKKTKLIIGPWTHGVESTQFTSSGAREFPDSSMIDYDSVVLDWLDHYVRDIPNDVPQWPAVHVYQMRANGRGEWVADSSWPLTGTQPSAIYLVPAQDGATRGSISWVQPAQSYTASYFVADPLDPVTDRDYTNFGGYDLSYISEREDVLTFDSEPLEADLRVIGQVKAEIYLSSPAPDCDLFVKLIDVSPQGKAFNLTGPGQEGMRVSYRNRTSTRDLLAPGQIVKLDFENVRTGNAFKKGHRIRVCICASWFPIYSRNLQTGELEGNSSVTQNTVINIHHDLDHQSKVIIPVVP
jgi:hypothetical protein